ncbi:MAG: glycerol-3-phosphate dehydrogenase [Verrucomicrobiaceae bacterium]|nr:glycerol-3-phosphate dehydrogenase [Verrucomicrobiaceae bacterium]|tara:strand:- start:226 stop:1224 length:999 start_codon:yes stop_codon:yes gene_type:complete
MKSISILGAGSWGTAIATVAAERGLEVYLWSRNPEHINEIEKLKENKKYLPKVILPESIILTDDLKVASQSDIIAVVIPSTGLRNITEELAMIGISSNSVILSCTKGIERSTGLRMTEIIESNLPNNVAAVLSGPNHAEEVGRKLATAAVIGCKNKKIANEIQKVFSLPWFRTYTSNDVAGIELGGAAKNIYAICAGISDGLGLGDNAKSALVTRGLAEMIRLGTELGGKAETFQGLSGVGDLIVTCYSAYSRNNKVGRLIGEGKTINEILSSMNMVAEGVPNTISFYEKTKKHGVNTPIIDQAYEMIETGKSPKNALEDLLSRDLRPETDQ